MYLFRLTIVNDKSLLKQDVELVGYSVWESALKRFNQAYEFDSKPDGTILTHDYSVDYEECSAYFAIKVRLCDGEVMMFEGNIDKIHIK